MLFVESRNLIVEILSSLSQNAFVFKFAKQQKQLGKKSRRNLAFIELEVLLITKDFFKSVPNLISPAGTLDASSLLSVSRECCNSLGGYEFNNDGKVVMEQKVLEPYYISNRTKLHFKGSEGSKMQSLLDMVRVFKKQNLEPLSLFFKSVQTTSSIFSPNLSKKL